MSKATSLALKKVSIKPASNERSLVPELLVICSM
jgi:hypothetical protein